MGPITLLIVLWMFCRTGKVTPLVALQRTWYLSIQQISALMIIVLLFSVHDPVIYFPLVIGGDLVTFLDPCRPRLRDPVLHRQKVGQREWARWYPTLRAGPVGLLSAQTCGPRVTAAFQTPRPQVHPDTGKCPFTSASVLTSASQTCDICQNLALLQWWSLSNSGQTIPLS